MTRNLEDTADAQRLPRPEIMVASDLESAFRLMLERPWNVVSMDMRLPSRPGAAVDVSTGKHLADDARTKQSLSKFLIFSATLNRDDENFRENEGQLVSSLGLTDSFGKAGRSGAADASVAGPQQLNAQGWAHVVHGCLHSAERCFTSQQLAKPPLSSIGSWLDRAPARLPPFMARLAQGLSNAWDERGTTKIDVALTLIEAAGVLALVQTLVILQSAEQPVLKDTDTWLPQDDRHATALQTLSDLILRHKAELAPWNWSGWMTDEVLQAFLDANQLRNELRHGFRSIDMRQSWARLLPRLRAVMDLCGYWALHPIYADLQHSRSGWRAQSLASTAWPTSMDNLAPEADFPAEAAGTGQKAGEPYWQSAYWREHPQAPWQHRPLSWGQWLLRDDPEPGAWLLQWARAEVQGPSAVRVNLLDGKRRSCPR